MLATAERSYPLREDNVLWTDNVPSGLARRVLLAIGARLAERGQLARPGDAAMIDRDRLVAALHDPTDDLRATARRRRAERAWVAAHPGPPSLGSVEGPPPAPDLRGLPEAARRLNEAPLWLMDLEFAPQPVAESAALSGVAGAPGTYEGTVRVVRDLDEFDRLQPGDVLVAPVTTPAWSILFGRAGALVTDTGGVLSHAAIVAREHGIPAVLATGTATTELRDGQLVRVDGTRGVVDLVAAGS